MLKLDDYMTIRRAAKFLAVSVNTLRNWGVTGKIPTHRNPLNGYRLYKKTDLEKLLRDIEESAEKPKKKPR